MRYYARIAVWILAALGVYLLLGLQFKWFGEVWLVSDRYVLDANPVEIKGPKAIFSNERIAVDPTKTYRLSAELRALPKSDGTLNVSTIYFGVQTFDANGRELKSGPGSYRYAGAFDMSLTSDEGWVKIAGLIAGEGDANHKEFRPGTRFVRLVLLLNYQGSKDMTVMVRNVEFSQQVTFTP